MLDPELINSFQNLCERHDRFLVVSHMRPDGDAYGSTLALALSLQAQGKDVQVGNSDGLASLFAFLPGSEGLATPLPPQPEDGRILLAVDCADRKRFGAITDAWTRPFDVNIDHHVSNPGYGKLNLIDAESPATAQVLYEILMELDWPLTPEVASNLYVGLMTDTGNFRYRQTTAHTFEIAARLVAAGADPTLLAQECYQGFRAERLLLMKEVFQAIHFDETQRVAWFVLTPETFERSGALPDETEGLIDYLQTVKTVEVAFLLESLPEGFTRASMRSRGLVDVQKICQEFGGGGHRLAAGLRTRLDPVALEKKLLESIVQQLPN